MKYNYADICQSAIELVHRTASFIEQELGRVGSSDIIDKDHNSLVSYVDKTAESMLVEGLKQITPETVFLTEEDTVENQEGQVRWIIDPLDGTTNFLYQIPIFSISIALEVDQELVVGVVYEVNQKECFSAWKGGGAFLNDHPIRVSQEQHIAGCVLATGYPNRNYGLLEPYLKTIGEMMLASRAMRRLGSAAVDLAYVACGRFGAFFEYGLQPWDAAAGILLVREAGGMVTDFKNDESNALHGREMLASNGLIHANLMDFIGSNFQ